MNTFSGNTESPSEEVGVKLLDFNLPFNPLAKSLSLGKANVSVEGSKGERG